MTDRRISGWYGVKGLLVCLAISGALCAAGPLCAYGQARAAATQTSRLSAFGGINGTYTGLDSGKNLGITGGVDLGFRPFYSLQPSVEVRGTYPFKKGKVDGQKNLLGGLQVARPFGRFRPYGDVLFGRGQIDYQSGGHPDPGNRFIYLQSVSNVLAFGGGVDFNLNDHFAVKADAQYQRYATPVTVSGNLYAKALTGGVVYRFDFNHHPRGFR